MCMGIPEGRVGYMGGSHMGKVSKGWSLIEIYIGGPDDFSNSNRGPDRDILIYFQLSKIFYFRLWVYIKLVSSLTSKPRELDRFRPCFYAYWYWNQRGSFSITNF